MKKIIFFLVIISIYLIFIDYYLPKKIESNIKTQFYLYFRDKTDFKNFEINNYFFPSYQINDLTGDNFFIGNIKINYFTKEIEITDGIFSKNFKNQIIDLIQNIDYLKINFKNISFINCEVFYEPYKIEKLTGDISLNKEKSKIEFSGFIENQQFNMKGNIYYNNKINLNMSFNKINFNNFFKDFLKIPFNPFLSINKIIDAKIKITGKINKIDEINFESMIDNSTNISMIIYNKDEGYYFNNGIIEFFNDDNNIIKFYGKILSDNSWSFIFNAKSDYLKIPYRNTNILLKNVDLEYSVNSADNNEIDLLKLYASNLQSNEEIYNIFNYFWHKKNFSYTVLIDQLNINNIEVNNLDMQLTSTNGERSINKFNFLIDKGKVLFSFINTDSDFKVAINTRNIDLIKLVKFIYNKEININGIFNVSFLGLGKNKKFHTCKGIVRGKKIKIEGIDFDEIDEIFKNHDIKNIKILKDSSDNESKSLDISFLKGYIGLENNKLKIKKLFIKGKKFVFKLDGAFDSNNYSNIIFNGSYLSLNNESEVIINLNLKEKFLQFIGK